MFRASSFYIICQRLEESITKFAPNIYADDTSITLGGEDARKILEDLQNELQDIKDWQRQNKLSLNVTKCEYMFSENSKQLGKISEIDDLKVDKD